MNDWTSLFHSLTADTLDSVDTLDRASTDTRQSVNSVHSVNVSEGGEQDVAISPLAAPFFCPLTADTLDSVDTLKGASDDGLQSVNSVNCQNKEEEDATTAPLVESLAALERRRPDHVESGPWQHAVEDGRRFLIQWGERATALGWIEADIFGLPPVPPNPHPSWRRLARVDQLGLVWLTNGRPVTSITAESATIAMPTGGSLAFYRPRTTACRSDTATTLLPVAAR